MIKRTFFFVIMSTLVAASFAMAVEDTDPAQVVAEKDTINSDSAPVLPEKDSLEYWMVRSQALSELTPFITRMRTETKGHYNALTDFLKYIGKGQEFAESGIKAPFSPAEYAKAIGKTEQFVEKNIDLPSKPFTWNQLVEWAMEFVLEEGYIPEDVSGAEEIEMIKKLTQQKEKYGRKVRDELRKVAQDCMDMKAYLESIDQFEACKRYARYQKEEKDKARLKRSKEGRDQLETYERARREIQRKNEWLDRQRRLTDNYRRRRSGYSYYRW